MDESRGSGQPHALAVLIILLVPLIVAVLSATARFTLRAGRPSGRSWGIAASTAMLLSNVVFSLGLAIIFDQTRSREIATFWLALVGGVFLLALPMAALGVAGIVAFWRDDAAGLSQVARKPPRVSGDGTNVVLDVVLWILAVAGFLAGLHYWSHWGTSRHLPGYEYGFPLSLILIGLLIAAAVHEAGHATVGIAVGMKLRGFIVGPLQWRIRDGKWKFQFSLKSFFGGATIVVPTDANQSQTREILMIAAGPVTQLLFGLGALELLLTARGESYEPLWGMLAVIVTICVIGFVGNLIPANPEGLYSDGARIYQLLKGGIWADYHRVTMLAGSTVVTSLRPRDYDIAAIKRAELMITRGLQAIVLRLIDSDYHLDRGEFGEAAEAAKGAETICRDSGIEVSVELRVALAFRTALLCRDPQSTRHWWNQIEIAKGVHKGSDYWLAKSALLLIEGQTQEAWTAWNRASDLVNQLPIAGDYEFDRYRCELLRQAISSTRAGAAADAVTSVV